jgi:hypothetical protein
MTIDFSKKKSATFFPAFICCEQGPEFLLVMSPGLRVQAITAAGPFNRTPDKPCRFQFFQVLGNGGLRQTQFVHQVAADAGIRFDQVLDDGDPGRVGKGFHHLRQPVLLV